MIIHHPTENKGQLLLCARFHCHTLFALYFSSCYGPEAILCHPSLSTALINKLYDLNDIEFDLPCAGHELDISWPAFSR